MTQTPIEDIELRLRSLPSTVVLRRADERAIARLDKVKPKREPNRTRFAVPRLPAAAVAALVLVLLANMAAAYYAPRYGRALADAPGIGPISSRLLGGMGLDGGRITAVGDSATSSGHTLKLAGGYADGLRIVLFVSVDGKGLAGDPKRYGLNPGEYGLSPEGLTLTDQFGRSYELSGVTGPTDLSFQPLAWPASKVGARLTLHVQALEATWLMIQGQPSALSGDWKLHVTLTSEPYHTIALPQPVQADRALYTFTSIRASETEMTLHWTIAGSVIDEVLKTPPGDQRQRVLADYFSPRLFDESARLMQISEWGYTWPKKAGPAIGEMTVFIDGPGRYRIQLGAAAASPGDQRWIVVP